ncbi:MAG: hypothetical protein Q8M16_06230 [Pirellulaceae bacterium]|nr:hypothetical protein [Pirellulaceae bacterium]
MSIFRSISLSRCLSILLVAAFSGSGSVQGLVFGARLQSTDKLDEQMGEGRDLSPVPIPSLGPPAFVSRELVEADEVEDWRLVAKQLRDLQVENLSRMKSVYCEEWKNIARHGGGQSTVAHQVNWYDQEARSLKRIMSYPPIKLWQEGGRYHSERFLPIEAKIYTPGMLVYGDRFNNFEAGKAFETISIRQPAKFHTGISNLELNYHWLTDYRSPEDFWAETVDRISNKFYVVAMHKKGSLVQLKLSQVGRLESYLLWLFDLDQGGFSVYRENRTTPSAVYVQSTQFAQFDNCWVPVRATSDQFDFLRNQWKQRCERSWYSHQINGDLSKQFEIDSLPVSDQVQVVDTRTRNTRLHELQNKKP